MIHVGTSGWQYDDWEGTFYPEDVPKRAWLTYFSERFSTVEVNNSFYRLPSEDTFRRWKEQSFPGFLFAVKASRYITHIKRLRDAGEAVSTFMGRARRLGKKIGPVLYQLPPNFPVDLGRLEAFLGELPGGRSAPAAFEFRHPSWNVERVHRLLDEAGAALVLADSPGARVPEVVTGGWSYVRFHRGGHAPLGAGYTRQKLRRWADRVRSLDAADVYVYFNNDQGAAAVRDARTFSELLSSQGADVAPRPDG